MTESLEARVDRLESIEAIKKLKHIYMMYCDLGYPPAKLGPLFVDEGLWTSAAFGHHDGRKAIEIGFWKTFAAEGISEARAREAAEKFRTSFTELDDRLATND